MFRIVCIVEDKHLPKILHAMSGLVLNMEPPTPVVNAVVKNGKIAQASSTGDSVFGRLQSLISSKLVKGVEFTTENLKGMIKDVGGNPASAGMYRTQLVETKTIKIKAKGIYTVV